MHALFSDNPLWLNLFFAAEWMVRIAMLVIVPMRRSPEAAKGWLLLIFFEPSIGLVLYLLIGRPTLPAWRLARQAEFDLLARPQVERLRHGSPTSSIRMSARRSIARSRSPRTWGTCRSSAATAPRSSPSTTR